MRVGSASAKETEEHIADFNKILHNYSAVLSGLSKIERVTGVSHIPIGKPEYPSLLWPIRQLDDDLIFLLDSCTPLPPSYRDRIKELIDDLKSKLDQDHVNLDVVILSIRDRIRITERIMIYYQVPKDGSSKSGVKSKRDELVPFPIDIKEIENSQIVFFSNDPDHIKVLSGTRVEDRTYITAGFKNHRSFKRKIPLKAWETFRKIAEKNGDNVKLEKSDVFALNKRLKPFLSIDCNTVVCKGGIVYKSRFQCRITP